MSAPKIHVFGLFGSGSNYLSKLLTANFVGQVEEVTGCWRSGVWKHIPLRILEEGSKLTERNILKRRKDREDSVSGASNSKPWFVERIGESDR